MASLFPAAMVGSVSTGADACCPVINATSVNQKVRLGKNPALMQTDLFGFHPCGDEHCAHAEVNAVGALKVMIGKFRLMYVGSVLAPGDIIGTGYPKVIVHP